MITKVNADIKGWRGISNLQPYTYMLIVELHVSIVGHDSSPIYSPQINNFAQEIVHWGG